MTDERFSEAELRALLERAVPQLPAPPQRLERVRDRALRRRRRRTAGVSATAVVAVALAGLLLPTLGGTSGSPGPTAVTSLAPPASGSAPTASGAPTTTDQEPSRPPTALPTVRAYDFPEQAGLRLSLPAKWFTIDAPKTGASYVSSQQLGLPPDGCVQPLDGFCTPLARTLDRGGVLMMLTLNHNQLMADKLRLGAPKVGPAPVLSSCRTVGGTAQLTGALVDSAGSDVVVDATVCLARPTAAQQAQVRDALTSADFG